MSATDYLSRSVYYDIADEARHAADTEPEPLPTPAELGCTDHPWTFCQRACYCARLAKAARR